MKISRLDFLKAAALSGAGLFLPESLRAKTATTGKLAASTAKAPPTTNKSMIGVAFEPRDRVRAAFIGVGGRGTGLVRQYLGTGHVDVVAICDVVPEKVANAQSMVKADGQPEPAGYSKGDHDYENLLRRDDIDVAIIATPWRWHVPMAVYAMEHGKHAFTEVPAAITVADCWKLVDTSERTRKHCIMMENCCYGDTEMMVLNMVRAGLFGDLIHGEAAYIHNLRSMLFEDSGEGLWRRYEHTVRDGNLYPTHGLGPVAQYMGVNRGDRFMSLVSYSSPSLGLAEYQREHIPASSPKAKEKYICGDMNTSIIKTALGRTIMLQHDTVSPRPYTRINCIAGTKATFRDYPPRYFHEGQEGDDWQTLDAYREKYQHPLWKRVGDLAQKLGGHGGMDFIMAYRLIESMRNGEAPDMDVYDAAAWSVPGPLSEASVKQDGAPQTFPDFTRGKWKERKS